MDEDKNLPMREKLDFQQVLFEYMILFGKALDVDSLELVIRKIESTLSPYNDKTFREKIEELKQDYEKKLKKTFSHQYNSIDTNAVNELRWTIAFMKYDALMGLARRKGLLPEETIGGVSLRDRIGV